MRSCLIAVLIALAGSPAALAHSPTAPVKLDTGLVVGLEHNRVEFFKGIPYAAPPVGPLRGRAPQPAAPWQGTRVAEDYGAGCMQVLREGSITGNPDAISEDCLTLNVFRPQGAAKKLPVMVWIHGGGLTNGASGLPIHDGTAFARGGVILVSINYRLGKLGFFAHPALEKEKAGDAHFGNYGLLDQIAALQWVKRNIAAFGGDADNVTIFGESAGAYSVLTLMVSPEARGLFHKVISQSGYGRGAYLSPAEADADGVKLAEALGAKTADAAALRALPADQIVAQRSALTVFIKDGKTLPQDMWDAFRKGQEAPVPLMIGNNSQESPPVDLNAATVRSLIAPADDAALEAAYGGRTQLLANLGGDMTFGEHARGIARLHSANGRPTYLFVFGVVSQEAAAKGEGARHATDIHYVFDTLRAPPKPVQDPVPAVAKTINGLWRSFAATGSPGPTWPKYDGQTVMSFTRDGANAGPDPRNARLDALTQIVGPKS